jgi:DNA-3-methyladenine glycosylase
VAELSAVVFVTTIVVPTGMRWVCAEAATAISVSAKAACVTILLNPEWRRIGFYGLFSRFLIRLPMSRTARSSSKVASIVPSSFYERAPDIVARALLGKLVVRDLKGEHLIGRIVEVEAYFGTDDPAAHSYIGRTARNAVLFGPPGIAYVYFIYGMYYCLNVSCEPNGQAGGVLIRALEPVAGLETMAKLRKLPPNPKPQLLTAGPGRLCQALDITRTAHNGLNVTDATSCLRFEDDGFKPGGILVSPRIGIRHAAELPARYFVAGNKFVSGNG